MANKNISILTEGHNFEMVPLKSHYSQVWFNVTQRFRRRRIKCEKFMTHAKCWQMAKIPNDKCLYFMSYFKDLVSETYLVNINTLLILENISLVYQVITC